MNKNVDKKWYMIGVTAVVILIIIAIIVSGGKEKNNVPNSNQGESKQEQTIDFNDLLNPAGKNEQPTEQSQENLIAEQNKNESLVADIVSKLESVTQDVTEATQKQGSDIVDNLFEDLFVDNSTNQNTSITVSPTLPAETVVSTLKPTTAPTIAPTVMPTKPSTVVPETEKDVVADRNENSGSTSSGNIIVATKQPTTEYEKTTHADPDGPGWSDWVK